MNKIITFCLSFVSLGLSAQQIHLQSGSVLPSKNIDQVRSISDWQGEFEDNIYCLIQFSKSTSSKERAIIESKTGISFLSYIPRWAFIASVPRSITPTDLAQYNIQSIMPYQASQKIALELIERPFPEWILRGNGLIAVLVEPHTNIAAERVNILFQQAGLRIEHNESNQFYQVTIHESDLEKLASNSWVKYIQPIAAPDVLENLSSRNNHRVNVLDADYNGGLHYTGQGVAVGIGDDGVIGPHIDFKGRVTHHTASDGGTHADHVAGIVAGAGNFNPVTKGNGAGADMHIYSSYGNLTNAGSHYDLYGVRITSNSLGQNCNAGYNGNAVTQDNLVLSKPSLLSVHSAGNSGNTSCGGVAQGYYTITGGYKAGKNAIAVGNLQKNDALAASSSRGPAKDGRIKPEICAVGTDVVSTQPDNDYDSFTGTSMACPAISGTLASLYEAYRDLNNANDPQSDLMKAILLNGADDLGNHGPDFRFGYGRVNARKSFEIMQNQQYFIDSVDNSDEKTFTINVPQGTRQLKVLLYWHDPAGTSGAAIPLVNDLNLVLVDPNNNEIKPWVLNHAANVASLNAPAVRFRDSINNIEQITLDTLITGTFTIKVSGFDVPQGPQKFVVCYLYTTSDLVLTYPQGGESFANNISERVRWDAWSNNGTFTLEYSADAGTSWNTIANNIPADRRYYDWTPPVLNSGQLLMRINRGAQSDVSDTLFSAIGIPTGLTCDTACANVFHLVWNPLNGADGYIIYMLGNKYMEEIGTSTTNDFYVTTGVNTTDTFYFAVAATNSATDAKGRRCNAYIKLPGDIACTDDGACTSVSLPFSEVYSCASGNNIPVTITVKNLGFDDLSNIPVRFQVNANPPVTEIIPNNISVGDSLVYTFATPAALGAPGAYTIKAYTALFADLNISNDTSYTYATVLPVVDITAPAVENFEGPIYPPNGWKVIDYDNNVKWQKTFNMVGANGGNSYSAFMDFYNYNNKNQVDDLQTAQIDLTNVTADSVIFTFDLAHAYGPAELDTLSLWISEDCATTFAPLPYKKWGANLATVGMMNTMYSPTAANQWRNERINLTPYKTKKVFVRFRGSNSKGNNLYIDNINILTKNAWPLNVDDFENAHAKIYPNPNDGQFIIEFFADMNKSVSYAIVSATGQMLEEYNIQLEPGLTKTKMDISHYASGVYFLRITDGIKVQHSKINKF